MKPTYFVYCILALLLGACAISLLAEDTRPPDTVPPTGSASTIAPFELAVVVKLKRVNKWTAEIACRWTVLRPVAITENGAPGSEGVKSIRNVPETVTAQFPFDDSDSLVYDARGNKFSVDAFLSHIKAGDVIVIYRGGRLPDPRYLRIFKDNTMILVRGDANTAPISADPKPPSDYVPNHR